MSLLTLSGSPHVHSEQDVKKIMWGVVIALIPAMLISVVYFGIDALVLTLTSVIACLAFEYLIQKYLLKGEVTILDGSAVITGVLLAFNVPSNLPLWEIVIGALVAIGIAKMTFGGLGKNPFNPALVGRVFLLISFPVDMTTWPKPERFNFLSDVVSGPTALGVLKEGLMKSETVEQLSNNLPSYSHLFFGGVGGSLGEVSALALILGGIYMLYKKIISWHIPVSYILTVFIFTGVLWLIDPTRYADPVFHLLAGGLMLGAIFMATDMVTSPMTYKGMLVFGLGCGILTVLIRLWGAYPEGVSFAILLMNVCTPLINKGFKPKKFGGTIK
ncbi:MAG: RnfABCDGE type electron transport complex subunit D [Bacteroidales bacterium]|nr:RnfABCDGE type electron transport complex subunit D [Bacteroidales bacterium]